MGSSRLSAAGFGFWRAYAITMRPYLLFVSGAAGLVGLAFAEGAGTVRLVAAFVPLFLSYGFGQALTDCFQTDTDSLSAPYRPLVRGVVSRGQVLVVSLGGLTLGLLLLLWVNVQTIGPCLLSVVGLLTYTRFKRTWWGGPPWNAWIVALLPIIGRCAEPGWRLTALAAPTGGRSATFLLATLAIFFAYASFVVMGYFKDLSADRATGYRTFPVVFGWRAGAIYSDVTALAAAGLGAWALVRLHAWGWLGVWAAGAAVNVWAQVAIHRTRDERRTHRPIAHSVRALVFYCAAVTLALRPAWWPLLAGFYAMFELALRLRPERTQV